MHPEYMTLHRTRTNERIIVHLDTALDIIKSYHSQQLFMTKLGQEDYWKRNRLTLWRDLKKIETEGVRSAFYIQFVNSEQLLPQIRWNLVDHFMKVYQDREHPVCDKFVYARDIHHWSKIESLDSNQSFKHPRVFRVEFNSWQIEHKDKAAFLTELKALHAKYNRDDLDSEYTGKRYYQPNALASRYVSMFYKIKEE